MTQSLPINVWVLPTDGSVFEVGDDMNGAEGAGDNEDVAGRSVYWRWQLLRLQDGKADEDEGFADAVDSLADGEIFAMTEALANLRQRIEKAGP